MTSLFDFNDVTISGNLTRDPALRQTTSGTAVCNIRIAHNERRKTPSSEWIDNPQYFDVTIWTSLAEWTARNVEKGDKVVISGRLRWSEYQAADGNVRQVVDINANSLIHIPRRDPVERAADAADAANAAEDHAAHRDSQDILTLPRGPLEQGGPQLRLLSHADHVTQIRDSQPSIRGWTRRFASPPRSSASARRTSRIPSIRRESWPLTAPFEPSRSQQASYGGGRIRTCEGRANAFTAHPL